MGKPYLIMKGAESPHTYRMRPSDAGVIGKASVIFMIGDLVETSLAGAIHKLGGKARVVELAEVPGLVRKPLRMGGAFEDDGHDHGHGHGHSHGPGKGHSHDDEAFDMHVWLDPVNAGLMAVAIARTLSEADPANAAKYEANAGALVARLDELTAQLAAELAPVNDKPFIVFHDSYRYFEDRFGLTAVGSAVVSTGRSPGVRRVQGASQKGYTNSGWFACSPSLVFDQRFVELITEGTKARPWHRRSRWHCHQGRTRDVLQPDAQHGRILQGVSGADRLIPNPSFPRKPETRRGGVRNTPAAAPLHFPIQVFWGVEEHWFFSSPISEFSAPALSNPNYHADANSP